MKKHFAPVVLFSLVAALWGCTSQELSYRMEDFSANNSGGDTLWGEAGARVSLRYPVFSSVSPTEADRANRVVDSLVFGAQGNADSLCAQFFGRWERFRHAAQEALASEVRQSTADLEQEAESDYLSPWYYAASLEVEADYRGCLSLAYTVSTNALDTGKTGTDSRDAAPGTRHSPAGGRTLAADRRFPNLVPRSDVSL